MPWKRRSCRFQQTSLFVSVEKANISTTNRNASVDAGLPASELQWSTHALGLGGRRPPRRKKVAPATRRAGSGTRLSTQHYASLLHIFELISAQPSSAADYDSEHISIIAVFHICECPLGWLIAPRSTAQVSGSAGQSGPAHLIAILGTLHAECPLAQSKAHALQLQQILNSKAE